MHKYRVVIYHNGIAIESWLTEARTKKGIEKKYKQKFREYRQQNYTYKIFSEEGE